MGRTPASFRFAAIAVMIAAALLLTARDKPDLAAEPLHSHVIEGVPHVRQKPDFCGEACVASWLQKLGSPADQDDVFNLSGLDPTLARGCYTKELAAAVTRMGFETGPVWHRVKADQQAREIAKLWSAVTTDLSEGVPSIVCMRTSDTAAASEHFRLVLGYDTATDEVIYHEPAADHGGYRRMPRSKWIKLWPLKYSSGEWTVIRMALRIDRSPQISSHNGHTDADYAQHIMKLKSRLPSDEFHVSVEHPFVVISDEPPARTQDRCERTIRWATTKLKEAFFSTDPSAILDIWLFKDKHSYDTHTVRLFGSKPSTPYGYYSASDGALVMNISTGGGTLVHEIVHPFMESNFPACPAWLNEGLGSLYEQSSSKNGRIVGLTNWRLAGLQRAIARDAVPSFGELCATTTHQFYRADPGTNYSQARYLCYYLQQHGLLRKFYHQFVDHHKEDPTGYQTLIATLAVDDMDQFKKDWQAYVMRLRFNG
jgi:hypothetical protein